MEFCGDGDEAALGQFGSFVELFADCSESVLCKMGMEIDRKAYQHCERHRLQLEESQWWKCRL